MKMRTEDMARVYANFVASNTASDYYAAFKSAERYFLSISDEERKHLLFF